MTARFDVVPFRIRPVASKIAPEEADFFAQLVEAALGEPVEFATKDDQPGPVAIGVAHADQTTNHFVQELHGALHQVRPDVEVVLLDARNLLRCRGTVQTMFAEELVRTWTTDQRLFVLLDRVPIGSTSMVEVLEPELRTGRVLLLGLDGRSSANPGEPDPGLKAVTEQMRTDPLSAVREKLLCVPGWFRREYADGSVAFARKYYEASFSSEELFDLMSEYLVREEPTRVFLFSPVSTWLEEPLRGSTSALGIPSVILRSLPEAHVLTGLGATDRVLVVVPMVDTGAMLASFVRACRGLGYDGDLRALSILSTTGPLPFHSQRQIGRDLSVDYFLKVEQQLVDASDPTCDVRRFSVPESVYDDSDGQLSVFEFWDLVDQAGTKDEEDVPPHRVTAGHVPNVPKMVSEYGIWLASRLMNLVARSTRRSPEDLMFICPAERGTEQMAHHLERLYSVPVVRVPRRPWLEGPTDSIREAVEKLPGDEDWLVKLRSASDLTAVTFDEFTKSGSTLQRLAEAAKGAGLHVRVAVVVLDMRPIGSDEKMPLLSLYRLPLEGLSD